MSNYPKQTTSWMRRVPLPALRSNLLKASQPTKKNMLLVSVFRSGRYYSSLSTNTHPLPHPNVECSFAPRKPGIDSGIHFSWAKMNTRGRVHVHSDKFPLLPYIRELIYFRKKKKGGACHNNKAESPTYTSFLYTIYAVCLQTVCGRFRNDSEDTLLGDVLLGKASRDTRQVPRGGPPGGTTQVRVLRHCIYDMMHFIIMISV